MTEPLLTTREVAIILHVDPSTVRRWVERHQITPSVTTPGGHHRFTEADLAALRTKEDDA
jgi:excisionase family DNA binding protein